MWRGWSGTNNTNKTRSKMKYKLSLLTVLLLPNCALKSSQAALNASALYDPPTVTLLENKVYQFKEGTLPGRAQKFHSDYSYRRAVAISISNL